jgi:hypothetical protein
MIWATSGYGYSNTSRNKNAARCCGDKLSSSTRKASDSVSTVSACSAGVGSVTSGSGSHSPTYRSRRTRAERSWSMASRVTSVAMYARGEMICSFRCRIWCIRRNASCTTSSASLTLPSIR